ncbi:hypothetical protein KI688_005881 [Linnemannia hyalina]|uniref:FAD-binding domain-containing protein n=1 Tax=Linnemannia hyalina TaxID=64524 RepID=A0A9P7Y4J9_9FUNG|nr:hypothetical protein KI688_005881 [Linnemannia hyalina]
MEINPAVTFKHDRSIMYAKRPKVLIVGAGLAGLTLGMLLHKAGIPFEIYERAAKVKPLGSAMYFSSTTANIFRQCGIYEEFVSLGKYVSSIKMYGANGYIVSRPLIYDLILRQIPEEHVHLGKKVLTMQQGGNGVLIRFSDGSEAEGDILVGADGAYSAVRQGMYEKLKKTNKLPASDSLPLPFSTVCLLGQTRPLSAEEFPDLTIDKSQFCNFIATDKMYTWSTSTTAQNTVCWAAILFLDEETSKDNDSFRNSEWGQEAAAAMCEQVKDFPVTSGGDKILTLQDLIDRSPKELISKVMLEEKVFKTWFDCRTVLIGDACHKFNPAGGVGAANAIHDAIALANGINGLPFHPVADEIEAAFRAYKKERIDWVEKAFDHSKVFRTMAGQSVSSKVTRYFVKNTPPWVMHKVERRQNTHRPQAAFLPPAEDKGIVRPAPQPSLSIKAPEETEESKATQIVNHSSSQSVPGRPKAPIIGAGLAGLTPGMHLHKAGIPFEIYERATIVKPLGGSDGDVQGGQGFPIIGGGNRKLKLKDLMDLAPNGQISKVMLEEKDFGAWYSGLTVLLNPVGGVGAANAMHDVIELACRINGLPLHSTVNDIEDAFKAYKSERIGWSAMVGLPRLSRTARFSDHGRPGEIFPQ